MPKVILHLSFYKSSQQSQQILVVLKLQVRSFYFSDQVPHLGKSKSQRFHKDKQGALLFSPTYYSRTDPYAAPQKVHIYFRLLSSLPEILR